MSNTGANPRKRRVALVCMPFADPGTPPLALSILAAAARRRGHRVDLLYLNLEAAAAIGVARYLELMRNAGWLALAGEWLASHPNTTPGAANETEFLGHLRSLGGGPMRSLQRLPWRWLRRQLDQQLDAWSTRVDWASYDVVGFGVAFQQLNASIRLAERIKERSPRTQIVMGGPLMDGPMGNAIATRYPWLDAVFRGEADTTFPDYLDGQLTGRLIDFQPPGPPMDELPTPIFDEFFVALDGAGIQSRIRVRLPIQTSRGCWSAGRAVCVFCGQNSESVRFRRMSGERVYQEVTSLNRYGESFWHVDLCVPKSLFRDPIPRMIEQQISLNGIANIRSDFSRRQLSQLHAVGLRGFFPGIESLSTPILTKMEKGTDSITNIWFLRTCEELGIGISWAILYGLPEEDPEELRQQARLMPLLSHLPPPWEGARPIALERFSPLYERAEEFGIVGVRPHRSYRVAFGEHPELPDQAYFFEFEFEDGREPETYAAPVIRATDAWRRVKGQLLAPRCEVLEVGGQRLLLDTRDLARVGRGRPRFSRLDDDSLHLLSALEEPRSESQLQEEWSGRPEELKRLLQQLDQRRLVVHRDGRWLRLVVMRERAGVIAIAGEAGRDKAARVWPWLRRRLQRRYRDPSVRGAH